MAQWSVEHKGHLTLIDEKYLRRLASKFFLSRNLLYKRNHDMILLQCVDKPEVRHITKEVHEGTFWTHANGHSMGKKILRACYYWLNVESDCFQYFVPPSPLNVLTTPWSFSMWGIDMIGMIEPIMSNGHRFIPVAIQYITKWVEAV